MQIIPTVARSWVWVLGPALATSADAIAQQNRTPPGPHYVLPCEAEGTLRLFDSSGQLLRWLTRSEFRRGFLHGLLECSLQVTTMVEGHLPRVRVDDVEFVELTDIV